MDDKSLSLEKMPFIRDLQTGFLEEACFLVIRRNIFKTKTKKPYIRFILSDRTGHMSAIFFGTEKEVKQAYEKATPGKIVKVKGAIEEFADVTQIKIFKLEIIEEPNFDLTRFFKRTPYDRRKLYQAMRNLLDQIQDKELKALCFGFFEDRDFLRLFLESPASRFVHHAYVGGLLEHTLHVMQLVEAFSRVFPWANRDLLLAGAFLHDIGKVDEYEFLVQAIDYTSEGKLKGHTLLGYDRLQKMLSQYPLNPNLRLKIEHILLSHQGKRVWGAVEEPRFLEAYLVHAADATDAAQFIYSEPKRYKSTNSQWSEVISYLGRDIYLG